MSCENLNATHCSMLKFDAYCYFLLASGVNPFSFKNFVAARSTNDDDASDVAKVTCCDMLCD